MARAACNHTMMHYMKRLIKKHLGKKAGFGPTNPVGGLAAQMLQLWATSFDPRFLPTFAEAYRRLLSKGIHFPAPGEGFKEQIVYRSTPVKSAPSKPKNLTTSAPSSGSKSSSLGLPAPVVAALDSIGEFLGFVFSITEDPNAPIPEDLLKPSVKSLEDHLKKVAELVDSNIGNEEAVRRLLEVNDQLDAAAKRLNGHRNIIDADDDDSSSDSEDVVVKKHKSSSKSKSAPNVADVITPTRKKPKTRHSSVNKASTTSASTNDLLIFGEPHQPTATTSAAPAATFDAFDFSHSGSAFAPSSNTGWASFDPAPAPAATTPNGNLGAPTRATSTPQMSPAFNGDASNGPFGGFDFRMAPPVAYSSPAPYSPTSTTSVAPPPHQPSSNLFNPFSFETSPASAPAYTPAYAPAPAAVHSPVSAMNANAYAPPSNGYAVTTSYTSPVSSPPPANSQSSQRAATTFGKYWANPETAPAPNSPSASNAGPFSPVSPGSNGYASPVSPTSTNYSNPPMAYNPAPVPATSNNPFL